MVATFSAPYTAPDAVETDMRQRGYAVVTPRDLAALCNIDLDQLEALRPSWNALLIDTYLKDGGSYRKRRHACFVDEQGVLHQVPHRAHWQSQDYNALHGGMHRWFEPIAPAVIAAPAWRSLLLGLGAVCSRCRPQPRWFVEAHQFRIDTSDGIGRPTPEGAHRDGVDFVAVLLVGRHAIKGGETRVFQANGPAGQRFTLSEPWSLLLLDDTRMIHESTPIQPVDQPTDQPADQAAGERAGYRDTLVLTWRAGGFQGDE